MSGSLQTFNTSPVKSDGFPQKRCPVCRNSYCNPKILPCLHTLCSGCIQALETFAVTDPRGDLESGSEGSWHEDLPVVSILCPVCDSQVELPPGGVVALSSDYMAQNEVFLESLHTEDKHLVCDLCSEDNAEKWCNMCSVKLCEFCVKAHRKQTKTMSHNVVPLRDIKGSIRVTKPILCSFHPSEELKLFCETCDHPVCRDCVVTEHRDHAFDFTSRIINKHGDYVRELLKCTQLHIGALEGAIEGIDNTSKAVQERVEVVGEEIKTFAQNYMRAIEKHRDRLLKQLSDLKVQKENALYLQKLQLEQLLSDMRTGLTFTEHLLTNGSDLEILLTKGVTVSRLKRLNETEYNIHPKADSGIRFTPQEKAGRCDGFDIYGAIVSTEADPSKCSIQGKGLCTAHLGQTSEFVLLCKDVSGEKMGRGGEHVQVSIVHKEKKDCILKPSVQDSNDGTYLVSFIPQEPGCYSVWVCIKGQHIQGSPFPLMVKSKLRKHRGVFHCCTFCSSGGKKNVICGCGGTMPGGYQGCGHGHKGHPGRHHWSCCGNLLENSECSEFVGKSAGKILRTVAL
ncbi:tripartite motif-containing protein 45 [Protopterus annectens]|uniref:tripartite motif-containing protein 45 n=1 Tax=Protopterus annectens TaxID=7888 RepID=UPI001CFAE286|nr:tripartite motif-containing protein 45 [Protopterus annectens]